MIHSNFKDVMYFESKIDAINMAKKIKGHKKITLKKFDFNKYILKINDRFFLRKDGQIN